MKKLLSLFAVSSASLPTMTTNILNINLLNKIKNDDTWSNINLDNYTETPASGTHETSATKDTGHATGQIDWSSIISVSDYVNADGYFALHPYDGAKYYNEVQLKIISSLNTDTRREWQYTETNDQWYPGGWGHQTSTITITLDAFYNQDEKITSLYVNSYVYARTAGSVHICSTTAQIDSMEFIPN